MMSEPMRWRMIAYMMVLFVAGAITGAAVMRRTVADSQTLKVGRSEEIANLIQQRLIPLNLTTEQREKFTPLVTQTSRQLEASHLQCLQACSAAVERMYAQIHTNLNADQLEQFNSIEASRREKMREKYNFPPSENSSPQP